MPARLSDGAPGPGFRSSAEYGIFDRQLLPLAVEAGETSARDFVEKVRSLYDVHPWTVSRWLWSANARGLIEPTDPLYGGFRVRRDEAAARLAELGR